MGRPLLHALAAGVAGAAVGAADGFDATRAVGLQPLDEAARRASIFLAVSLDTPVTLLLGLALGLLAWGVTRAVPPRRLLAALASPLGLGTVAAAGGALGVGAGLLLAHKEIDWAAVDWAGPALLAGGAAVYSGVLWAARRLRCRWVMAGLVALLAGYGATVASYARAGSARASALTRVGSETKLTRQVLRRAVAALDRDGDGYPVALCGDGCDCDDTDPRIHPAADDIAGNGVDEDCSGADMTLAERDAYAAVFARPGPRAETRPTGQANAARSPARGASPRSAGPVVSVPPHPTGAVAKLLPRFPGASGETPGDDPADRSDSPHTPAPEPAAPDGAPAAAAPSPGPPPPLLKLSTPGKRPNILLITVDTVRADHLGIYGYKRDTSPNLDALGRRGVVFEQARSAGPSTRFSVAPMLTSKWFTELHRTRGEWPRILEDEVFLAERLKALGYTSAAFHSIRYLRPMYGLNQGFDHYSVACLDQRGPPLKMISSDFITDETLAYADAHLVDHPDKPFFLWAYYGDPHSVYRSHPGFAFGPLYRDRYDGEIAFADHHIGRLLEGLKARGLDRDLIVIMMSDHGEGLDPAKDHGTKYHSKNLYDELVHVPFLWAGAGMEHRRVATPVSLIDLVPTLLELIGAPPDPALRGTSLVPLMRGEDAPHPPVFFEKHRAQDEPQKGMVLWPYKVIMVMPYSHVSIFDLAHDPHEQTDISRTMPKADRARLVGIFKHWATEILQPAPGNYRH